MLLRRLQHLLATLLRCRAGLRVPCRLLLLLLLLFAGGILSGAQLLLIRRQVSIRLPAAAAAVLCGRHSRQKHTGKGGF